MTYVRFPGTTHKSRKTHVCGLCAEGIYPGENYERHSWVQDGDFCSAGYHPACLVEAKQCSWYYDPDGWSED